MYINIKENIVYEDDAIVVCKKNAGIPVQTAKMGQQDMVSLLKNYRAMKKEEPYIGLIHRLDQPVEGIMVFAKTKQAAADLSKQVSERMMDKMYYAVTLGTMPDEKGTLFHYMLKDGRSNTSKVVSKETKGAKQAELYYEVIANREEKNLVRIQLKTGRHHQIRVQMATIGCPLYGDSKYGGKKDKGYLPLGLCSYKIGFIHPTTKEKMEFEIKPEGKAFSDFISKD